MRPDYGYVAMAIEQIRGFAENATGVVWPTDTIKSAKANEPSGPFLDMRLLAPACDKLDYYVLIGGRFR